jgi:diguanylate cyclase (GGDEF)-like protein
VARFGGEEFTILLPGANADEGGVIAERIRARMAAQRFTLATAAVPVQVTVSLGIASYPEHGRDLDALLHRADLAVYRATTSYSRTSARSTSATPVSTRSPARCP